ncbi:Uncharacterized protein dnm_096090 [Desulfonema magnum]|uniref:Uncharacterized protein n=1 Tax=Desulfonema magnum TaxID=45655 RepID=A0A975GVH8_9BACT|nr:Uncharacterized protein dnm_096090 [Desulfonema magnum]
MLFRRRKNIIFALRIRLELPKHDECCKYAAPTGLGRPGIITETYPYPY